jgi:hypothetical protein
MIVGPEQNEPIHRFKVGHSGSEKKHEFKKNDYYLVLWNLFCRSLRAALFRRCGLANVR